jgi:hypothetical protein
MRLALLSLAVLAAASPVAARETVDASPPAHLAVSIYRDPARAPDQELDRNWPQGFAMISETRTVTLPPGESTIRFGGVSEGMVAVTAIVTGLPGGTIEKNRNADLLSPAALVDGALGNRVTVTRTNPATGRETSEQAIVRTRADGGVVLQTSAGLEAVRCSGLPERLTFTRVPEGLSAQPVYSVDTLSPTGGNFTVTLTYLSWGFDWQAHYVATLDRGAGIDNVRMRLMSWLTLVNDNGQSFPDAELLAVAGRLNVTSDYRALADPPQGRPLRLQCYPVGSTAAGSRGADDNDWFADAPPVPAPPPPPMAMASEDIMVTGSRIARAAMVAREEDLADLKLYRVPEPVTIAAKGQKQIAFLDRNGVNGSLVHHFYCAPDTVADDAEPAALLLATVNDARHGLGAALPTGTVTVYEATARGDLLVGERGVRDYAAGQDVEIDMGSSGQVFGVCSRDPTRSARKDGRARMKLAITNANPAPVRLRITLGDGQAQVSGLGPTRLKDGERIYEGRVAANSTRTFTWAIVAE